MRRTAEILRDRRGMTMMELIAGMVLFAVVASAVSAILFPVLRVYTRANELAEFNTIIDSAANVITTDMARAAAEIDGGDNIVVISLGAANKVTYSAEGGVLQRNGTLVFPPEYYRGKSIGFDVRPADESDGLPGGTRAYILTVNLSDGGMDISRSYAVRPLALNQY